MIFCTQVRAPGVAETKDVMERINESASCPLQNQYQLTTFQAVPAFELVRSVACSSTSRKAVGIWRAPAAVQNSASFALKSGKSVSDIVCLPVRLHPSKPHSRILYGTNAMTMWMRRHQAITAIASFCESTIIVDNWLCTSNGKTSLKL